jgi:hypothetical protein
MEMTSSTISDLRPFVRRRDLLLGVNGGIVRLQFCRYGLPDLTSPSQFWIFFLLVAARRIILVIFVPAATSSTMVLFSLEYWWHCDSNKKYGSTSIGICRNMV